MTTLAICQVESEYRNVAKWDHKSYSYGICQIKMGTAKWITKDNTIDEHMLLSPDYNFYIASRYYSYNLRRYGGSADRAISAYNRGSYSESNRKYVQKVKQKIKKYKEIVCQIKKC